MAKKIRNRTKIVGKSAVASKGRSILNCIECGQKFSMPNCHIDRGAKYCSPQCLTNARDRKKEERRRECKECGKTFYPRWTQIRAGKGEYCSQKCHGRCSTGKNNPMYGIAIGYGKDHPRWTGGFVDKYGYRMISVKGKRIREHRHIMQEFLGRKLSNDEVVHHIDRDKLNNDIVNLAVMTKSDHTKEHIDEMLAYRNK